MSSDSQLIKVLSSRENYDNHARFVKKYTVLPETAQIILDMGEWYKSTSKPTMDWTDFKGWFRVVKHPTWKPAKYTMYDTIIDTADAAAMPSDEIIKRFIELDYATRISNHADEIFKVGLTDNMEKIGEVVDRYNAALGKMRDSDALVDMDLEKLLEGMSIGTGISWRLACLNKSIGPVHKGDLVIVGKRPEVGGTTFLTSEFTKMVLDLPTGSNAIIFNNEEAGDKIGVRYIQSALNQTVMELAGDVDGSKKAYAKYLGSKRLDVLHDTSLSTRQVERVLRSGAYGLIGINVLDKVVGFSKSEGVERVRSLAQWARQIADKYGIVMAVMQADASAEGEKWLNQSQLYGSKTGVQGEADVLIMIGKSDNPAEEDRRFISICKNKKPGSAGTDPKLRHGHYDVAFDGERGRFK